MYVMGLRLDSSSAFVPRTISGFIAEVSAIGDCSLRLSKLGDFVAKLEEEKRKIDAFKRELPISVLLVDEAIERLKEEARVIEEGLGSRETRAIEEFMPLKRKATSFDEDDEDEEEDEEEEEEIGRENSESDDLSDKRDWMSSAQLWSSSVDFDPKPRREREEEDKDKDKEGRVVVVDRSGEGQARKYDVGGGAFVPFKASSGSSSQRLTSLSLTMPQISELGCGSSSLTTTISNSNSNSNSKTSYGNNNNNNNSSGFRGVSGSSSAFLAEQVKLLPNKPQPQTQTQTQAHHQSLRKQRRCWSPELHRRFVDALQQLGGSQAATPKQIRELMQVEGLTNDEVKSHLQKYRLHVRKLPNSQATQGGGDLWMTQQDQSGDNSKANMNISQSSSPQGPLLANGSNKALSNTGGDSTEVDEDDERSDGHSWRGHGHNNHPK